MSIRITRRNYLQGAGGLVASGVLGRVGVGSAVAQTAPLSLPRSISLAVARTIAFSVAKSLSLTATVARALSGCGAISSA